MNAAEGLLSITVRSTTPLHVRTGDLAAVTIENHTADRKVAAVASIDDSHEFSIKFEPFFKRQRIAGWYPFAPQRLVDG